MLIMPVCNRLLRNEGNYGSRLYKKTAGIEGK